jgi:DNA-directed RNA polymerase specialized sigma24 family protein
MVADEVVARAAAGDANALESLLHTATPKLRTELSIDARFRRNFDLDDVLQVTFLEAFLRIRSLKQATAAALGRSEGTVHMLRARAHDRLRELLRAPAPWVGGSEKCRV